MRVAYIGLASQTHRFVDQQRAVGKHFTGIKRAGQLTQVKINPAFDFDMRLDLLRTHVKNQLAGDESDVALLRIIVGMGPAEEVGQGVYVWWNNQLYVGPANGHSASCRSARTVPTLRHDSPSLGNLATPVAR